MLTTEQAAIVKGMLARGDKQHDIAAYFSENGGRIADINTGKKFADVQPAALADLPALERPPARYIDPNAPLRRQSDAVAALINNPPENSRTITFSPELAEWIVTNLNTQNRRKRPAKIKHFADCLVNRKWRLTGDTIKFSKSGTLIDGQNRLSGCVRAGIAMRTYVVFGIEDQAFPVIDTGATRNNPDTFQIAGIPNPQAAAPAVRWLMIMENNPTDRGRSIDNLELLDYYKNHVEDIDVFAQCVGRALSVARLLPTGALAAHLYLFSKKDPKTAAAFADDLQTQKRGGRVLFRKIEALRKQSLGRLHENQVNALIRQAWASYRSGQRLTMAALDWTETKDFPAVV